MLTPAIVFLSVVVAAIGVSYARKTARQGVAAAQKTARQKATLDLIEKTESNEYYQALNKMFSYYRRKDGFSALHDPEGDRDKKDRQSVVDYLNHYELVAIGIESEILDEQFYQGWMEGVYIRDWTAASDFVQRERWKFDKEKGEWRYHEKSWCNFQKLATRWSDDAPKINAATSGPPSQPSGPGDDDLPDDGADKSKS